MEVITRTKHYTTIQIQMPNNNNSLKESLKEIETKQPCFVCATEFQLRFI